MCAVDFDNECRARWAAVSDYLASDFIFAMPRMDGEV
jgi:hypothetical protein